MLAMLTGWSTHQLVSYNQCEGEAHLLVRVFACDDVLNCLGTLIWSGLVSLVNLMTGKREGFLLALSPLAHSTGTSADYQSRNGRLEQRRSPNPRL